MNTILSEDLVNRIIKLNENFDESNEDCYEDAANLLYEVYEKIIEQRQ
jgi:hypothetical protein